MRVGVVGMGGVGVVALVVVPDQRAEFLDPCPCLSAVRIAGHPSSLPVAPQPPGAAHGPFKSEKGCILLESHYYRYVEGESLGVVATALLTNVTRFLGTTR